MFTFTKWARIVAAMVLAASAGVSAAAHAQGLDKLYVLDCGWAHAPDQSRWSPGVNVGVPIDLSDNCYLLHHTSGGYLLWDTGINDGVANLPNGLVQPGSTIVWRRPKTLIGQLAALGIAPKDIQRIAISHFHADHTGNVDLFPQAVVLMQRAEYDFAFAQERKPFSADHPVKKLEGDFDVFGDGSAMILSTPGHTPGHESLLVHLPKTGAILLSGDTAHFQSNWDNRRVPGFNFSQEESKASLQRVADILAKEHAQYWINHDKPQSETMKRPPAFYD